MVRLCEALAGEGYRHLAGYEYELYLVRAEDLQPPFMGIQIFATLRNSFDEAFMGEVLRAMPQVGVDIITANAEYGPCQKEINFAPAIGVAAADQAFTFKNGIKEIARLAQVGRWWVGGQLAHLPALTAIAAGLDGIRNRIEPPPATRAWLTASRAPPPSRPAWRQPWTRWRRTASCGS